jgi:hypothetical protein
MSTFQIQTSAPGAPAALAAAFGYLDRQGFFSWWQPSLGTTLDGLRAHGFDSLDQLQMSDELSGALGRTVPEWREGAETLGDFAARI